MMPKTASYWVRAARLVSDILIMTLLPSSNLTIAAMTVLTGKSPRRKTTTFVPRDLPMDRNQGSILVGFAPSFLPARV